MGTLGVGDVPVGAAVDPDVEVERLHQLGHGDDEVFGDHLLLEDVHVPVDHEAAVEGGDGCLQVERIDEHLHALRGPAAGDGEQDAGVVEPVYGRDGCRP